jgi:hypothetical protein
MRLLYLPCLLVVAAILGVDLGFNRVAVTSDF